MKNLVAQPNDPESRTLRYDPQILVADRRAAAAVDERAKHRDALMKMRTLWNDSAASADRAEGEDGVAYQKRLRAEW